MEVPQQPVPRRLLFDPLVLALVTEDPHRGALEGEQQQQGEHHNCWVTLETRHLGTLTTWIPTYS